MSFLQIIQPSPRVEAGCVGPASIELEAEPDELGSRSVVLVAVLLQPVGQGLARQVVVRLLLASGQQGQQQGTGRTIGHDVASSHTAGQRNLLPLFYGVAVRIEDETVLFPLAARSAVVCNLIVIDSPPPNDIARGLPHGLAA
jgi:hypothetical protein